MLFSEPGLVALSIGAMVGNVFGLAVPDEVAKRELPVPLSCCAQHVPFRLRMKTNINNDDPMAEKNLNYYFKDRNPVCVACECLRVLVDSGCRLTLRPHHLVSPDSKGEKDVPLTVGTENASIFELETFIPSDTTAQLYNKLRIVQYNLSSSGAWDKPWLRPSVTEGTDRVQGQGYHTLMISQFPEQATK